MTQPISVTMLVAVVILGGAHSLTGGVYYGDVGSRSCGVHYFETVAKIGRTFSKSAGLTKW